jgi:TRAP-type mannitol/chloroaromatic compound transport system permease small subunit
MRYALVYLLSYHALVTIRVKPSTFQVRAQNTIQIIGIVLFNLCCFIYSIFQFRQINNSIQVPADSPDAATSAWLESVIRKYMIAASVIIGVCELGYLYLGARLYQEFGYVECVLADFDIAVTAQLNMLCC